MSTRKKIFLKQDEEKEVRHFYQLPQGWRHQQRSGAAFHPAADELPGFSGCE